MHRTSTEEPDSQRGEYLHKEVPFLLEGPSCSLDSVFMVLKDTSFYEQQSGIYTARPVFRFMVVHASAE